MEILIRLAGVQLGPYSEEQIRQHLSDGLLSLTDPAQYEGMPDWVPLGDLLVKLHPTIATQKVDVPLANPVPAHASPTDIRPAGATPEPPAETAPNEVSDAPKRAPAPPPGVTVLPARPQEPSQVSLPAVVSALAKKSNVIGPTAPASASPSGPTAFSTVTTSPLVSPQPGTKKLAQPSKVQPHFQDTSPLPTKPIIPPPTKPPAPNAPETDPPHDSKREPPLSANEEVMAKTVPMRSMPTPAPARSVLPITTPLPTKPVFKPDPGTVPPPSVVGALTKKMGPPVLPEVVQTSPPTLGLMDEVKTVKLEPPLGRPKAKSQETPPATAPAKPVDEPAAPVPRRRLLPKLIGAWAALALVIPLYVWWPYHDAALLRNALDAGDAAGLNAVVDFPSVRRSLEQQISNQIAHPAGPSGPAGSRSDLVLFMLGNSIEHYVTPDGIAALVNKSGSVGEEDQKEDLSQFISSEEAAKILLGVNSQPVSGEGLASLGDFVLDRGVIMLHLRFQGLGWKLVRVDLRPDLGLPGPNGSAAPLVSPVVEAFMDRGMEKSKKGDWSGAINDFSQVLAIDPQSSVAYHERGAARQAKGDADGAVKDYTQALAIDPQMASAYNGRGDVKLARNDLDGAIADYTQAVGLDPKLAAAYDNRGKAKTARNDLEGAIADFTQALSLDPNLAGAYSDRAFARQAYGNLDGAIADYTQALALKPQTAAAYYNRGLARQAQGNIEGAIVDFDRALSFDPTIAGAYFYRGNAKSANHDLDGAITDYTQALKLNPKIAPAYSSRGLARQAKGDLDGAVADFTQALAIDPKIAGAYYSRSVIEAQKNDLDDAIADSSQALDLDPKNAQAYATRGFAKLAKGNLDGTLQDLKQFCDLAPRDHNADHARLYLWLISKAQNATTDADQDLSNALETSWNSAPDDQVSKTALFFLGRLNESDYLAAAASADAKTDQAQRCQAWYFAGMKRLLVGDKKGAVEAFHQCLATEQKDYCEYVLAQTELQALEPPVPPASAHPPAPATPPATPSAPPPPAAKIPPAKKIPSPSATGPGPAKTP
jgi:tetratricopeptide (TPR) repeat protein